MSFAFRCRPLENYSQWAYFHDAFSAVECDRIIALFDQRSALEASVGGNGSVMKEIRDSNLVWIPPGPEDLWIFERIAQFAIACNEARWKLQMAGLHEPLQLTRYKPGQFYDWHQDSGPGAHSIRKLSVVVQLTDPSEYSGGELQFLGFEKEKVEASRGSIILFPSYNPHRVTTVTEGTRHSLVAWVSGDPYR